MEKVMTEENAQETEDDTFFEGMDETAVESDTTVETETEVEAVAETKETEAAPTAEKEPVLVPRAAMLDERRKRQQLEDRLNALEGQLPKNESEVDFYDSDKDAYDSHMRKEWETEQFEKQQKIQSDNLNKSRSVMLESHDDYIEMEKVFEIMTISDESLIGDMLASGDAAKFAYDKAKEYKESLIGGTVKTEIEPEIESEANIRNKSAVDAPSLATATATASNTVQVEKEEDIDDVFADIAY